MTESENAAGWYDGPDGKAKWIADAESIEAFVKRAFEAGWAARNGQIDRLAVSLEGERELAGERFEVRQPPLEMRPPAFPEPGMPAPGALFLPAGPPPVTRIEDYQIPPLPGLPKPAPVLPGTFAAAVRKDAQRYVPTEVMPALPDDTNPGFRVPRFAGLEHTEQVWDGKERAGG